MRKKILNDHVIYGEWDDVSDDQFMVYYHPNGKHCSVFIFSGCDYGGGIFLCAEEICSKSLDSIIKSSDGLSEYDIKQKVINFIKSG